MLLRPGRPEEYLLQTGKAEAKDVSGGRVMLIHYGADPEKDEAWAQVESRGVPQQVWQREYEGRTRVFDGVPVFPEYRTTVHEVDDIPFPRLNQIGHLIAGIDCGNTLNPYYVLVHVTPEFQIHFLQEVAPPEGEVMPMSVFAPLVLRTMRELWTEFVAVQVDNQADPSGAARQGNTGHSAYDEARNHGLLLRASTNNLQKRIGTVATMLMDWIEEGVIARCVISRRGCPLLCAAWGGGYRIRSKKTPDGARILELPEKNEHSHPADGGQYAAMRAMHIVQGGGNEKPHNRGVYRGRGTSGR